MNASYCPSISMTPFFANYGFEPLVPWAVKPPSQELPDVTAYLGMLSMTHVLCRDALRRARDRSTKYLSNRRRPVAYKKGDWVLVATKHLDYRSLDPPNRKLSSLYIGPFQVTQATSNTVTLDLPQALQHARLHPCFNVSRVRPYYTRVTTPSRPAPDALRVDGDRQYVVDRLVARRTAAGDPQLVEYLCVWQGYGLEEATWVARPGIDQVLCAAFDNLHPSDGALASDRPDVGGGPSESGVGGAPSQAKRRGRPRKQPAAPQAGNDDGRDPALVPAGADWLLPDGTRALDLVGRAVRYFWRSNKTYYHGTVGKVTSTAGTGKLVFHVHFPADDSWMQFSYAQLATILQSDGPADGTPGGVPPPGAPAQDGAPSSAGAASPRRRPGRPRKHPIPDPREASIPLPARDWVGPRSRRNPTSRRVAVVPAGVLRPPTWAPRRQPTRRLQPPPVPDSGKQPAVGADAPSERPRHSTRLAGGSDPAAVRVSQALAYYLHEAACDGIDAIVANNVWAAGVSGPCTWAEMVEARSHADDDV